MKRIFKALFIFMLMFAVISCSPDTRTGTVEGTASISVRITDSISAARIIVPGGEENPINTDVTHYVVTLYSSESESVDTTGRYSAQSKYYLPKDSVFTVSGIPSGLYWIAKVEAYAETTGIAAGSDPITKDQAHEKGYDFVKVAEGYSESTPIFGNGSELSVSLDKLGSGEEYKAGNITVTLILPPGFSSSANGTYSIYPGIAHEAGEDSVMAGIIPMNGISDDKVVFTIQNPELGQGYYFMEVNVEDSSLSRCGATIIRMMPEKDSSGTINLDYSVNENTMLEIIDHTGSRLLLTVSAEVKDQSDGFNDITITVESDNEISAVEGYSLEWDVYIDGIQRTNTDVISSENGYAITIDDPSGDAIEPGLHKAVLTVALVPENGSNSNPLLFGSSSFEIENDDFSIGLEPINQQGE